MKTCEFGKFGFQPFLHSVPMINLTGHDWRAWQISQDLKRQTHWQQSKN
jgi:hypothetical protein